VAIPPPPQPPTPPTRPLTEAELRAELARREAERRRVEREEQKREQQRKRKEPLPPFELGIDFFDQEWKLLTRAWWMLSNHDKQEYLHQKVMEMRRQGRLPPTPDDPRFDQLIKLGPWQAYIEDPTRRLTGKDFVYKLVTMEGPVREPPAKVAPPKRAPPPKKARAKKAPRKKAPVRRKASRAPRSKARRASRRSRSRSR